MNLWQLLLPIDWPSWLTTADPPDWPDRLARWLANAHLEANRATEVRPCPSWQRLDALMGGTGKVEPDAWTPSQILPWWRG